MDDTHQSRASDAAATRKRRSSILKSQRPARTPFSELEFNVATPTDTTKSRRVSFSRRTGVAEFITNEATTTWKNVYEEHNKSLESSGNDSDMKQKNQPVEHLGKRIFDDQFEEVEAFDYLATITPSGGTSSISNANFIEQHASLESSSNRLTGPLCHFELSALTDHQSKLFGNEFTVTGVGEMSGRIEVNFSAIEHLDNDDLAEMEKDLEQGPNVVCRGPSDHLNVSEYVEVDLNTISVVKNDACDMSITDTINSQKVQNVSKNCSKVLTDIDWVSDKENIVINPYAAPQETENFAVNNEPDQVLVFDGKRLTLQSENTVTNYRNLLPNSSAETPQRKTIVLNMDDDLPNFGGKSNLKCETEPKRETVSSENDMSMTRPVSKIEIFPKHKSIYDNTGNISITETLLTNIMGGSSNKQRTMVYEKDDADISMTQALPAKIITETVKPEERRRTIVYEQEAADISITQMLPSKILQSENAERTDKLNKSNDDQSQKRKTIIFDENDGNISITQALCTNIVLNPALLDVRRSAKFEDKTRDLSMTQVVHGRILSQIPEETERRQTIFYGDNDSNNISMTKVLPSNIILGSSKHGDKNSMTEVLPPNILLKHNDPTRTIVFEDDMGNISITQGIAPEAIRSFNSIVNEITPTPSEEIDINSRTFIYNDDSADVSITELICPDIISRQSVPHTHEQNIPSPPPRSVSVNEFLLSGIETDSNERFATSEDEGTTKSINCLFDDKDVNKDKTTIVEKNICPTSTESIIYALPKIQNIIQDINNRTTVISKSDISNLSLAKPIPSKIIEIQSDLMNTLMKKEQDLFEQVEELKEQGVIVYTAANTSSAPIVSKKSEVDLLAKLSEDDVKLAFDDATDVLKDEESGNDSVSSGKVEANIALQKDSGDVNVKPEFVEDHIFDDNKCTIVDSGDLSLICEIDNKEPSVLSKENDEVTSQVATTASNVIKTDSVVMEPTTPVNRIASAVRISAMNVLLNMSDFSTVDRNLKSDNAIQVESNCETKDAEMNTDKIASGEVTSDETLFFEVGNGIERSDSQTKTDCESQTDFQSNKEVSQDDVRSMLDAGVTVLAADTQFDAAIQTDVIELKDEPSDVSYDNVEKDEIALHKTLKNANNTQELLDMISNFTDKTRGEDVMDENTSESPTIVSSHIAIEDKIDTNLSRRHSFVPNRQSIVYSREDLLNNISMAQAALQKPRVDLDNTSMSVSPDDSGTAPQDHGCVNSKVVKTLHFDDESFSVSSLRSNISNKSPLKKHFLKKSVLKESKAKVIPSFLKDVTDGLKELMSDLVKPMADSLPFDTVCEKKQLTRSVSTNSTQIQADLMSSSQIDLSDGSSYAGECFGNKERSSTSLRLQNEFTCHPSNVSFVYNPPRAELIPPCAPENDPVLIFDEHNPLNNILLGPIQFADTHAYKPSVAEESVKKKKEEPKFFQSYNIDTSKNVIIQGVNAQYSVDSSMTKIDHANFHSESWTDCPTSEAVSKTSLREQIIETRPGNKKDSEANTDIIMKTNKSLEISNSPYQKQCVVKDSEVNTYIIMQENKKLLESSSSLTLVGGNTTKSRQVKLKTDTEIDIESFKTIQNEVEIISKLNSIDRHQNPEKISFGKKRNYRAETPKKSALKHVDTTPKPSQKIPKLSDNLTEHLEKPMTIKPERDIDTSKKKNSDYKKKNTRGSVVSVQHVGLVEPRQGHITKPNDPTDHASMDHALKSATSDSCHELTGALRSAFCLMDFEDTSSFTSSKNLYTKSECTTVSPNKCDSQSNASLKPQWQSGMSSHTASLCDVGANIVAKIDMLPFMGSHECEWESSSVDTWCFRLLHGRIRLTVRLAHRHANLIKTRVRADTPVNDITVDTTHDEKKNPIALLCVRYACETMRFVAVRAAREKCQARAVPQLLKRCAAVSRVAVRWGRAMHDAKLHLAYTLDNEGHLALKVANIPLRSVWEVCMDLELVVDEASVVPWPRAANVRVLSVVSDVRVRDHHVRRVLHDTPRDWGNVPRTLWRMFRYLKHKTNNDDLVLGTISSQIKTQQKVNS